ncbi:COM1 protein [Plectosphaerella plurivora]|uniref:COM1 protein n=1 Tax=Plectosphaerella plurivora TaxID=936078 RepID=A0A9P8VCR9_9PEZI|nr:COM1 protein [Plectosphaerella plurivora]
MASLRVPDTGLQLESSGNASQGVPAQAFALTLSDSVIEDMIKCVQNGEDIQLSLGSSPTFLYGSQSHTPAPSTEQYPLDIYLTKPFESTKRAARIPTTSSLWQKPTSPRPDLSEHNGRPRNATSSSVSSSRDSDLETLQNSIAAAEASRKHTNILETMPKNVSTKPAAKSKYLSSVASYNKGGSRPNSPALTAVGSPSLNPGYGASQKSMDKAKGQRTMIVHELAAEDRTTGYLESKWSGPADDFKTTLEKVADYLSASDTWALKKMYWKELDVWKYDYDSQDDRQSAIDRAVKIFDRTRLGLEEPPWEKLLPKEERGKGKHLSKVQANIAKVSAIVAAPKIKVDGASDTGADDVLKLDGSESVGRSSSQPLPAKKKAPAKFLSSKPKASTPKPTQSKAVKDRAERALPVPAAKPGKFLSEEYVVDSDSDSSEKPMASVIAAARSKKPSPAPRAAPKPVERPAMSARPKQKAKPIERPVERAKPVPSPQPAKRRREEDEQESESSSSSGRPLAKRIKPKPTREAERAPLKAPVSLKQRPAASDSQGTRGSGTNGSLSFKSTKNTSPVKSSPLASSPPTNASDLEQQRRHPPPDPIVGRKRKVSADTSDDGLSSKGSTTSSADSSIVAKRRKMIEPALVRKASMFKTRYAKYANLHREVSSMDHPPRSKIEDLEYMRDQLARLKAEIYKECPPAIAVA